MRPMASLPSSKTVTYEEWLQMPEVDDGIEEVVNGEIQLMPPAKMKHAWIVKRLEKALERQLDDTLVAVFAAQIGLVIRKKPLTSRVPDIGVFVLASMVEKDGYIHSAPQLAVEVPSPANTRRRMEQKLGDYGSIGVPEVWIVSPNDRTVEVWLLEDGYLRRSQILAEGLLQPKLFPHVKVEIAQIWPD